MDHEKLESGATESLSHAICQLEADPGNHSAWLRVALRLYDVAATKEEQALCRQALDSVAHSLGEAGQLPLALVALRRLSDFGPTEERLAQARLHMLAAAYGKTSSRVDPTARSKPPQPPRSTLTPTASLGKDDEVPSLEELRSRGVASLRKAAAHAIAQSQGAEAASAKGGLLPPVPLFSALSPDAFVKLAQSLHVADIPATDVIFSAGEPGDAVFFVARGTVRIERPDGTVLARLRAGQFFGEMSLLVQSRRTAHAIAETSVILMRADRLALEALTSREPQIASVLAEHARRRLLQNAMTTSPLFANLSPDAKEQLMARFSFRRYDLDEVLIEEGKKGVELFVILSGRVQVSRKTEAGTVEELCVLGLGDVIGEMSLLGHGLTTAMVHALEPTTVMTLSRSHFEEVVAKMPQVRALLSNLAAGRLPRPSSEPINLDDDDVEVLV